jgi:hypothetical protein
MTFSRLAAILAMCSSVWAAAVQTEPAAPQPPSPAEQTKLLDAVRRYALTYTHRLPDFICLEQTRRYVDAAGTQAWQLMDVLTARLSYFNQKEDYKLVTQNGHPATDTSYESAGGTLSMGDFGTTMRDIFDPASHTSFAWKRWTTLRGRRTLVFSYRVSLPLYAIEYQAEKRDTVQRTKVAYRGWVFVDKQSNKIVRITHEALNIQPSFPVKAASETLDYDFVRIGEREFFLPLMATLEMQVQTYGGKVATKNEKEFRLYRKFSAEAAIKFDGQELPPLPDDKTKEQSPQPPQ